MQKTQILKAWGRILTGYEPVLSIEITKACPLSCPGCYAYQPEHVDGTPLVNLTDFKDHELVTRVLQLVARQRPLAVYMVGGEPLVRFRELNELLPKLCQMGTAVRVVTSAVLPIPLGWTALEGLDIIVSVDGLQPEHDERRKPATYDRILRHIEGHRIVVHCTITSHMLRRDDYIEEFMRFWSDRREVKSIQVSLFTPQVGERSVEILTKDMRRRAVAELGRLRELLPKIRVNPGILKAFLNPPSSPRECLFARATRTISADLTTVIEPCQFGGTPDCSQCGCLASMALHAVGERRVAPGVKLRPIFEVSNAVGSAMGWLTMRLPSLTRREQIRLRDGATWQRRRRVQRACESSDLIPTIMPEEFEHQKANK